MASINKRPQKYVAVGSYLPNKISYLVSSLETFESIDIKDDNGVTLFSKKQRVVGGISDFEISSQLRSFVQNKPFSFVGTIEDKEATQKFYITGVDIDDVANVCFAVAASLDGYEQSLLPFVANQNNLTKFLQVLPKIKSYDISGAWLSILSDADYVQFVSTAYNHLGEIFQTATRNQELARGGMARIYLPYVIGAVYGEVFINEISEVSGTNLVGGSYLIHTQYDNRNGIETSLSSSAVPTKTTFEGINVVRINSILPEFESQKPYWDIAFVQGKTYAIAINAFGLADTNLVDSLPISIDVWSDVTAREKITSFESLAYNNNIAFPNTQQEKVFLYTHTEANDTRRFGIGVKNELNLESVITPSLVFGDVSGSLATIKRAIPDNASASTFVTSTLGSGSIGQMTDFKGLTFYTRGNTIFRANTSIFGGVSVIGATINNCIAIDRRAGVLAFLSGTNKIALRNIQTNQSLPSLNSPIPNTDIDSFLVDVASQSFLYIDAGVLYYKQGNNPQIEITTTCTAFTVDWAKNVCYFVLDDGVNIALRRINLTTLAGTSLLALPTLVTKLDIDVINQKLYYLTVNTIRRIDVDGTNDTLLQSDTEIESFSFMEIQQSNVNLDLVIQTLNVVEVEINQQSSEVQRIDYEKARCNATQLVWANNIGGWDTFVFDGYRTENFEIEETAVFTDFTQRTETNVIRGGRDRHTLSAGPVTSNQVKALKSLYTSKYVFKVEKNVFTPVIIATNTFSILNTKDQLFEVSFDILLPRNNL